jgi:hypothetical protein
MAAGNSSMVTEYEFIDKDLLQPGLVYYRIKQIDFDGEFEYHGPRAVSISGKREVNGYPNPVVNDDFVLNFGFSPDLQYEYILMDALGNVIKTEQLISKSSDSWDISLENVSSGIYFIRLFENNQAVGSLKLLKK